MAPERRPVVSGDEQVDPVGEVEVVASEELDLGQASLGRELDVRELRRPRNATYTAFVGSGFAFANWAARIPQVRDHFHLTPGNLGLVIFTIAVGSVISLPLSGTAIARAGAPKVVAVMSVVLGLGVVLVAIGYMVGLPVLVAGLFMLGLGNGAWDVAMNVHASVLEQRMGRSIMPRFHAGWSIGTVAGAGIGALAITLGISVGVHLLVVAVLIILVIPISTRGFIPGTGRHVASSIGTADLEEAPKQNLGKSAGGRKALAAWTEPRTLATGAFVLAFAFAEGSANDWTSVAAIGGYHFSATLGTLTLATFLACMTIGRWFVPLLLDRFGRVPVARCLALLAGAGVALFVYGPSPASAFLGAAIWGLGTSVGFPLGMSAGGDDPARAAARVSVIASIGYCAFLGGPPLVGFLGNQFTVRHGLLIVAALLLIALVLAPALRPESPSVQAGGGSAAL